MRPIFLRRPDLALALVAVLNRHARKVGRLKKAYLIESHYKQRKVFEVWHPEVERGESCAILRLILSGYRTDEITPIMVSQEREHPRFGALPS